MKHTLNVKTREDFISENFNGKFKVWFVKVCLLTAVVFLLSSSLDLIRHPGGFLQMLVHRLPAVAVLLASAYALKRLEGKGILLHYAVAFLTILFCAAEVEHRILLTGGGESHFFLDLIMIGILFIGYVPGSMWFWGILSVSICLIYTVPLMLYDKAGDMNEMAFRTAYIMLAYLVLLYMRLLRNRAVINQLALRYELIEKEGFLQGP
jgi:hypothetical protein